MFQSKVYRSLKGSIAIYILFWGMLCITMMLIGFTLEIERSKNISYIKKQVEITDFSSHYREELFSDFYDVLINNNVEINQSSVDEFIINNYSNLKLTKENRKYYFKDDKIMIIRYLDTDLNNVFECFSVKVINGRLKFIKVQGGVLNQNIDL